MNAFNGVNLSAACILTSVENAEKLGIAKTRWVHVLGGAGTHEKENCWFPNVSLVIMKTDGAYSLGKKTSTSK